MHIVNTSLSNIYLRFAKVFVSSDEYLSAYDGSLRITYQTEAFIAHKQWALEG